MSPYFEDRMSLAHIEFPVPVENCYLHASDTLSDTTDLCRSGSLDDKFVFLNDPVFNAKAAFYLNQLAQSHLSCRSFFPEVENEVSLIDKANSVLPVMSDLGFDMHHALIAGSASLHRDSYSTPGEASASLPVARSDLSSRVIAPVQTPSNTKSTSSLNLRQRLICKSTSSDVSKESFASRRKAAHNAVEKRYRTNMNAKFMALGNAIPSLHTNKPNASINSKGTKINIKDGRQMKNKSEVLTKALAYIQQLEEEKHIIRNDLCVLRDSVLPGGAWRRST
ncbi:HLH DNA binding domain protein, putative [Paecilomyces variotii No. 5]|uniref:HLH DNA binding domain protein, putative n=1 Tax=Byssochlamys spectabilis (strain No. 5 / NBRC 109023) TaxID=1356009 RepID=V5FBI7_BYSSN|nr:HLH DNA binding domain protein, putative [Paecilomyces variotii No. 5]